MTVGQMFSQSGILTLLGMGVVFLFLVILILVMKLLHVTVHALKLDKEEKKDVAAAPSVSADNGEIVAAIAAAVHEKEL